MSSFVTSSTLSSNPRRAGARFVRSDWSAGGPDRQRAAGYRSADNLHFGQLDGISARLWTPGLLDRLQEPITRYHE